MISPSDLPPRRNPDPDEAQLRYDAATGKQYIYVEAPSVGRFADMSPEKFVDLQKQIMANQPTREEIRTGRWNDD
jgi:hypothetical protein